MNAREVIAQFRSMGPQDPNVTYSFFADHARDFTLMSGEYLHEPRHWSLFFRELAVESRTILCFEDRAESGARRPAPQLRWVSSHACPDCNHEHANREECGYYLGEGKFCHCPSKVVA